MSRTLKNVLNEANPNQNHDALRQLRHGDAVGLVPRHAIVAVASDVAVLPEDAKAAALLSVYVSAGTVDGEFDVVRTDATLLTGDAQINEDGDVEFLPADAVTEAEIVYLSHDGEIVEQTIALTAGIGELVGKRARVIIEATDVTGGGSSALTVVGRSDTLPAAGQIRVGVAGDIRADTGTTIATVRAIVWPVETVDEALASDYDRLR